MVADSVVEARGDFGGGAVEVFLDEGEGALGAEHFAGRRLGFLDAVGADEEDLAGLELDGAFAADGELFVDAEREAGAFEQLRRTAFGAEIGGVAGAGIVDFAFGGIELGEEERNEVAAGGVGGEDAIDVAEDFAGVVLREDEGAEIGPGFGHEERGAETVVADIGDDETEAAVAERDVVVEVAAGFVGGTGEAGEFVAGDARGAGGKQTALDVAGDAELGRGHAEGFFGVLAAGAFDAVANAADEEVVGEVAFDEVVLSAGLDGLCGERACRDSRRER